MANFIVSLANIIKTAQQPLWVCVALAVLTAGYCFIFLGANGKQVGKVILIGAIIGAILVMGCNSIADSVKSNVNF